MIRKGYGLKQRFKLLMRRRKKSRKRILHLPKRKNSFQAFRKMINLLLIQKAKEIEDMKILRKELCICLQLRKKSRRSLEKED